LYLGHPGRQTLAGVNHERITVEEFNKELEKLEEPLREMNREEPQNLLEGMIVQRLLLQEAKKEGISAPAKTYKDTAEGKNGPTVEETRIMELMKKKFSSKPEVTQEEVQAFYSVFKGQIGEKPLKEVKASRGRP
jgi:hypothetical protein